MCRLFGFRSVIQSQVHRSLVSADNALMQQSERHPDGWGVAYYLAGAPHVIKSVSTAVDDHLFQHVSGIVTSETVLAHLRKATQGDLSIINTHPYQHGHWVFAHNGNVKDFGEAREALVRKIPAVLRRFILGNTDSEVLFYLLLGKMQLRCQLERRGFPLEDLADASREMLAEVTDLVGDVHTDDAGPSDETYLTYLITNGRTLLAHQGGKTLYVSTHKNTCPERDECPHYAPECEKETDSGFVSHLIFSSEPLQGQNVWNKMQVGDMVGVDWRMQMKRFPA
jgi:glutamine amidotransferase